MSDCGGRSVEAPLDDAGFAGRVVNERFSTIDFHSGTQRLAVGTHEGAVIMYVLVTGQLVGC